jgi:hypothetical protein
MSEDKRTHSETTPCIRRLIVPSSAYATAITPRSRFGRCSAQLDHGHSVRIRSLKKGNMPLLSLGRHRQSSTITLRFTREHQSSRMVRTAAAVLDEQVSQDDTSLRLVLPIAIQSRSEQHWRAPSYLPDSM